MFHRYAKAWAAAFGTLIATAGVAFSSGDAADVDGLAASIGGGLATLFVLFGPANGEEGE